MVFSDQTCQFLSLCVCLRGGGRRCKREQAIVLACIHVIYEVHEADRNPCQPILISDTTSLTLNLKPNPKSNPKPKPNPKP